MQLYHTNKPPFFLFDKHFRKWQGVNNKLAKDASCPNLPKLIITPHYRSEGPRQGSCDLF